MIMSTESSSLNLIVFLIGSAMKFVRDSMHQSHFLLFSHQMRYGLDSPPHANRSFISGPYPFCPGQYRSWEKMPIMMSLGTKLGRS